MTPEEQERLRAIIKMMMDEQQDGPASEILLKSMAVQADQLPANSLRRAGGPIPQYSPIIPEGPRPPQTGYGGMMESPPPSIGYGGLPGGDIGFQMPSAQPAPSEALGPPVPPTPGFVGGSGYGGIGGGALSFPPQAAGPQVLPEPAPGDLGYMGPLEQQPSPDIGQPDAWPGGLPMRFPPAPVGGVPELPDAPGLPELPGAPGVPELPGGQMELPPGAEQPGDLERARAGRSLDDLRAMRDIGEGFGRAQVVTTGDIIHKTQKGVQGRLPYRAEGLRQDIATGEARELAGMGAREARELEDRKQAGRVALEKERAKGVPAKILPETALKGYDSYKNFVRDATKIQDMAEEFSGSLGPFDNLIDTAAKTIGWQSGEVAEFRRLVTQQLNDYIREMTGAQLSAHEAKRLLRGMPSLSDTQKAFSAKLKGTIAQVKAKQKQWMETRRGAGYDVSGLDVRDYKVRHKGTGKEKKVDAETYKRVQSGEAADWEAPEYRAGAF